MQLSLQPGQALVLFDGECAVCDRAVLFILDRDPKGRFVFAPLQSPLGQAVLQEHAPELAGGPVETMALYDGEQLRTHSSAALYIGARLAGPVKLVAAFWAVPRALRDWAYRAFAARRLRWFGSLEQCRVVPPELRQRFLA